RADGPAGASRTCGARPALQSAFDRDRSAHSLPNPPARSRRSREARSFHCRGGFGFGGGLQTGAKGQSPPPAGTSTARVRTKQSSPACDSCICDLRGRLLVVYSSFSSPFRTSLIL